MNFYGDKKRCCLCIPIYAGVYMTVALIVLMTLYELIQYLELTGHQDEIGYLNYIVLLKLVLLLICFITCIYFLRFDTYKSRVRLGKAIVIMNGWSVINIVAIVYFYS